jgi:hypothetical protein
MLTRTLLFCLPPLLLLLDSPEARAELDLRWGGKLQSDIRFRTTTKGFGGFYDRKEVRAGVARNENIFKLKMDVAAGRFFGVAEVDLVYLGYSHAFDSIGDLGLREEVDPFRIEAHAIYIEATDILLRGLDLRVGQQQVFWGKGDQFNPTNTINPNDVEDPLLFGEQVANLMVKLDYTPGTNWTTTFVLVPIFKPALLPDSAPLGLAASDRMPMIDEQLRWRLHTEQGFTDEVLGFPTVVTRAVPDLPERSADNMQWAARIAGTVWDHDIAFSYYMGRTDVPQAYLNLTRSRREQRCNPDDPKDCINGLLETETRLGFPRMQVAGFNMAGQLDLFGWLTKKIKPIGYRIEVGVYFPQAANIVLVQEELDMILTKLPAGEYEYRFDGADGGRPLVVDDTPFAKWVVGLDYTFNKHLYANIQWVHGMADEFGAGDFISEGYAVRKGGVGDITPAMPCLLKPAAEQQRCLSDVGEQVAVELLRPRLADYLVIGVDVKLLADKLLLRLFSIWDLSGIDEERWDEQAQKRVRTHHSMFSKKGFSAVIYPELLYSFGNGFDLGAGALLMLGEDHTKFGDPASGGSQVFTRARLQF